MVPSTPLCEVTLFLDKKTLSTRQIGGRENWNCVKCLTFHHSSTKSGVFSCLFGWVFFFFCAFCFLVLFWFFFKTLANCLDFVRLLMFCKPLKITVFLAQDQKSCWAKAEKNLSTMLSQQFNKQLLVMMLLNVLCELAATSQRWRGFINT